MSVARRAEERVRQSRGSDLDRQRACVRTRGWEGERERARHGVQWRVCEVNTFGNRVGKGVDV